MQGRKEKKLPVWKLYHDQEALFESWNKQSCQPRICWISWDSIQNSHRQILADWGNQASGTWYCSQNLMAEFWGLWGKPGKQQHRICWCNALHQTQHHQAIPPGNPLVDPWCCCRGEGEGEGGGAGWAKMCWQTNDLDFMGATYDFMGLISYAGKIS